MKPVLEKRAVYQGRPFIAHTPSQLRPGVTHSLAEHSLNTAKLAAEFAKGFGGESFARFLGLIHDIGKATAPVQQRLHELTISPANERIGHPHKAEGAALSASLLSKNSEMAAVAGCAASYGHHSRIPDWVSSDGINIKDLLSVITKHPHMLDDLTVAVEEDFGISIQQEANKVTLPQFLTNKDTERSPEIQRTHLELFIRMCHSALVDADYLDTQAHFDGSGKICVHSVRGMNTLLNTFVDSYHNKYGNCENTKINVARQQLFDKCIAAGSAREKLNGKNSGIYRLPAPTGSGKTLASAAFALTHAVEHKKDRVIVAVPFTSITTQNAQEYREIFAPLGNDVVLENHSNIIEDDTADSTWRKLSAENWDAEFIVTTTVQLFESLFSNRPSKTRKLHRLANSVIVLDEIQALPLDLLPPILKMLNELVENYGVTVLLASATQPAFWNLDVWKNIAPPIDICSIDKPLKVFSRVTYQIKEEKQTWEEIAQQIAGHKQCLTIVNTTADAQKLYDLVKSIVPESEHMFHLSTRMHNAHRLQVLNNEVKKRLHQKLPITLISTQLIEAGVDIDFPIVCRAAGPAESIIQSAGRCNREGKLNPADAHTIVFTPTEGKTPPGHYRLATNEMRRLFISPFNYSFADPQAITLYYKSLYSGVKPDGGKKAKAIEQSRASLNFSETSTEFKMIENHTLPVVIKDHINVDDKTDFYNLLERLQTDYAITLSNKERYLLSKYTAQVPLAEKAGPFVTEITDGIWLWNGDYRNDVGATPGTVTLGGLTC